MIVGPPPLNQLFPRDTGLQVITGPALLGPVWQNVAYHSVVPLFLIIGKLIYLRRLAWAESENLPNGDEWQYRQWMVALYDQALSGEGSEYSSLRLMSDQIDDLNQNRIKQIKSVAAKADEAIIKLLEGVIVENELYLDPEKTINHRIEDLIIYMQSNELYFEDKSGGFSDYFKTMFKDTRNQPADFPKSNHPRILDAWITNEVIDERDFV